MTDAIQKAIGETAEAVAAMRAEFSGQIKTIADKHSALIDTVNRLEQSRVDKAEAGTHSPMSTKVRGPNVLRKAVESDRLRAFLAGDTQAARHVAEAPLGLITKALLTSREFAAGSPTAGVDVPESRATGVYDDPRRRLTILDVLRKEPTAEANEISYLRNSSWTPAADIQTTEGATKPEESFDLPAIVVPIKTYATTAKVSQQVVNDVPALEAWLRGSLSYSVLRKLENQIIATMTLGGTTFAAAADNLEDRIGEAVADQQANGYVPGAIIINPVTFQGIAARKGTDGHYLAGGGWAQPAQPVMWSVPVIVSAGVTQGLAFVLDLEQGFMLWDRQQLMIEMGYADDDFVRNQFRIRAELRAAIAVPTPDACYVVGAGSP
jgi:HK97 family phage major capsid protein